ncbi:MAG: CoA transferase [Chloroflexi bacterium]|nr:CoA transferase [Chloroflexota bacterium]
MDLLAGEPFAVASHGLAAAYVAWLLRQYGAEVDHQSALDPSAGPALYLCEGARPDPAPKPAGASPLITDAPITAANRAWLEAEAARRPVTWITPWGHTTDWAERPATDLIVHAAGGWMSGVGEPGREPIGPPGAQAQFAAGLFATVHVLSPAGKLRGLASVSIAEAVAATCIYDVVAFQYYGNVRQRVGNRYAATQPMLTTLPCKDGYVGIHAALHAQWVRVCQLIGHPELVADPRFADPGERARNIAALDTYLLPWLATRTRWEAYHELQAARVPASALPTVDEVLASPQLAARDAWREVPGPGGRPIRVPGPPARVERSHARPVPDRPDGPWRHGSLRVLDLSMGWAGPLVSHILSCYGADVIKVEGPGRIDWWRGSRPPGDDPANVLHERSHVFNTANRGKRGITLDLTSPEGRAIALQLADAADVVVENFRAGVLERLGLGYDALSERNPGLILLRQPGFGAGGPEGSYQVFGNTIEGMSGLTAITGYEDGPPLMMSNAFGDPVSGLNGTIAVLAALSAKERDHHGAAIEAAQIEGFLPMTSEALIAHQVSGEVPARRGNRRPRSEPSGAFRCAGDDRWLALEVRDGADWAALASILGQPWDTDASLSTVEAREARRSEIHEAVEAWTSTRDRDEAVEILVAAGIPAAPVNDESDQLAFGPFAEIEFFAGSERAVVGYHLYPSLPILTAAGRPQPPCPAPLLGEHTAEVLAGLGLTGSEVAALSDSGIVAIPA